MKNFNKLAILTFTMLGFTVAANAQSTATAPASATVVKAIAIAKSVDMNFGTVAVKTVAGTVVLAPTGGRTFTGGVTLPAKVGTVAAAQFNVTGEAGYTYAVTLPTTDFTITGTGTAPQTMVVNAFTSTLGAAGTGTLDATSGAQTITVGATLNVKANQAADTYTNAAGFEVTVNYN